MAGKQKKYEDLNLSDDFMFGKIMRNPVYCKEMLERLLDLKITDIEYPEDQKSIDLSYDSRSVRLDIYVEDAEKTVYNVEIQTEDTKELPQRARYYSDMIDLNLIEKGTAYKTINKSFVIFICTFDLFGRDFYRYTFENVCREDKSLLLKDGAAKIFFNTEGKTGSISDGAKAFLQYTGGRLSDDDFVRRLDEQVRKARKNEEWRREYMTLLMRDQKNREEGREEGLEEGLEKGREEGFQKGHKEGEHDKSVEMAKKMIELNENTPQYIAEFTGLKLEEVEVLANLQPV